MFKASEEYARPIWDTRIRDFNLYVGNVTPKKYKSEANFHVPYCSTLLNNVLPLLTARLPESKVIPRNSDRDREAARKMEALLQYTFDINKYDLTFINTIQTSMLSGSGWLRVGWNWQDTKTDHASITLIDSYRVYPHSRKVSLDDNWPIFIVTEMTKAEMIEAGWDKTAIHNLSKSSLKTQTYRRQILQSLGMSAKEFETGTNPKDDVYEVIEVMGNMDLSFEDTSEKALEQGYLVIANRESLINLDSSKDKEQFASPYNFKKIPLCLFPYETIPDILLGIGFITPIASQQEELDALENMKADNYKRRNNPPIIVRRSGNVDLSTLQFVAATPWEVNENGDIQPYESPDLAPSIDNQQGMVKSVMQARTGANDVLLVDDATTLKGGNSATGAAIANENTKTRFRPHATRIDLLNERLGEMLINLYQDPRFFDREKELAIADEDGNNKLQKVGPKDVKGDLEFRVTSASSIASSADSKLQRALNLKEIYIQDPTINQDEMDKQVFDNAEGYDYTKVKRPMQSMNTDAQGTLEQLTALAQSPQFSQLPPDQQQQILGQIKQLSQHLQAGAPQQGQPGMSAPQPMAPQDSAPIAKEGGL